MINVEYANETKEKIIELSEIKKLVKYAVKYMKLDNVEFGIIFVNNKRIREINKEYRNIDRETDVITFRLADYEEVIYDRIMVLGDIYISLDKARSQLYCITIYPIIQDLITNYILIFLKSFLYFPPRIFSCIKQSFSIRIYSTYNF